MRYKEAFSGGQFGIKGSITTEAVTAAAALHFKRPVRYIPTMEESILMTSKRHAYQYEDKDSPPMPAGILPLIATISLLIKALIL